MIVLFSTTIIFILLLLTQLKLTTKIILPSDPKRFIPNRRRNLSKPLKTRTIIEKNETDHDQHKNDIVNDTSDKDLLC